MYGWMKQYCLAVPLLCALSCTQPAVPAALVAETPVRYRTEGRVREIADIALERDRGHLTGVRFMFYAQRKDAQGRPYRKELHVRASRCVDGSLEHLIGLRKGDAVYTQERFATESVDVCAKEIGPVQ